jgi:hypothetical protein
MMSISGYATATSRAGTLRPDPYTLGAIRNTQDSTPRLTVTMQASSRLAMSRPGVRALTSPSSPRMSGG